MNFVGSLTRPYTVTSLYEAVMYAGINPMSFFGLTVANCPNMESPGGCNDMWVESSLQGEKAMTRQAFAFALHMMEQRLADYMGYWPGPKYIENERHMLGNWNKTLKTNYRKVVRTGTRKVTQLARGNLLTNPNITQTATSIPKIMEVKPQNYYGDLLRNNAIRYQFGTAAGPDLNIPDNCNLLLFPENMELESSGSGLFGDPQLEQNWGYVMRPYLSIMRQPDPPQPTKVLSIDVPLFAAIRPIRWFRSWPNKQGITKALDACDANNWTDTVSLFKEEFVKPDGHATISQRYCQNCGGRGCTNCDLPKLPICLIPIDSEMGRFRVQPLRETTVNGQKCWVVDDLESCCKAASEGYDAGRSFDYRWTYQCFCSKPLEVCINYVSSCHDCFGPDCITQGACPSLLPALTKLTLSELPVLCKCECTHALIDRLRHPYTMGGNDSMRTFDDRQFDLGMTVGAVEAWLAIRHMYREKNLSIAIM